MKKCMNCGGQVLPTRDDPGEVHCVQCGARGYAAPVLSIPTRLKTWTAADASASGREGARRRWATAKA